MCLLQQKSWPKYACCDKTCHDKITFVATNISRDKTKMILVAASANVTLGHGDTTQKLAPPATPPPPPIANILLVQAPRSHVCRKALGFNPFTAPACSISRLNDKQTRPFIFCSRSYDVSTFGAVRSGENPFICLCKKEEKRLNGFKFCILLVV